MIDSKGTKPSGQTRGTMFVATPARAQTYFFGSETGTQRLCFAFLPQKASRRGRSENHSTIMTSNRPLEDWGKLIGDVSIAKEKGASQWCWLAPFGIGGL